MQEVLLTEWSVIDQGRWQCEIENSSKVSQRQETLAPHNPNAVISRNLGQKRGH